MILLAKTLVCFMEFDVWGVHCGGPQRYQLAEFYQCHYTRVILSLETCCFVETLGGQGWTVMHLYWIHFALLKLDNLSDSRD